MRILSMPLELAVDPQYRLITMLLAVNVLVAVVLNNPFFRSREKHLGVFSPIVLWIAIMLWALVMRNSVPGGDASQWPLFVLHFLFFLNLPFAGFIVFLSPGFRYYTLSICAFLAWLSYCAYVIAQMLVSGAWG